MKHKPQLIINKKIYACIYEMMHKAWCSIEEMPYCFLGHPSNFNVTQAKKSMNLMNPIWVRLLGRSQLSNPSDLACF